MQETYNKEERQKQKTFLRSLYSDYDPRRHTAFIMRYNREQDKKALNQYMRNRGIIE